MTPYFHIVGTMFVSTLLACLLGIWFDGDDKSGSGFTAAMALFTLIGLLGLLGGAVYWLLGFLLKD